ncbi:hypothetical protein L873DRAFT_1807656, partial [Choiromyces venosus 120613-1]
MEPNRMRKIEVQSPEDIRFILENLTNAARAKINQHLPPSSADNNNDELRKRVEGMVIEVPYPSPFAACDGGDT